MILLIESEYQQGVSCSELDEEGMVQIAEE
jgi:hypothetical protein